jgi:hypothetical protein
VAGGPPGADLHRRPPTRAAAGAGAADGLGNRAHHRAGRAAAGIVVRGPLGRRLGAGRSAVDRTSRWRSSTTPRR